MQRLVATILTLVIFSLPVLAQPNAVEAVLIKQFLVCDRILVAGCEFFGLRKFSEALVVFTGAAEQDDKAAYNNLGMLYETGAGVVRSESEAKRLYMIAAESGIPIAQYNLAMITVTKHVIGDITNPDERDRDMSTAFLWLTLASKGGLSLAEESREELIEFMTPKALKAGKQKVKDKQGN